MSIATVPELNRESPTPNFDDAYRQYSSMVYRTARAVTGNLEDAEDVLQTIFLRLMRQESAGVLKKNPRAYLYRAAVNLSLDLLRARQRRSFIDNDVERLGTPVAAVHSRFSDELHRQLNDALAQLSPEAAQILVLRYVHNNSDAEILVIEGEVRVQRGDREKNLLPGQQLATNPGMESRPLSEEISWSRNAEAHLTMLRQSTTHALTPPLRFEVTSIKPSNARTSVTGGCRGTDGKYVVNSISPDPPMGRCVLSNGTLQHLISFAYSPWPAPLPLTLPISRGPDWLRSDRFTVEARSADPSARIPDLQRMLQNLLSDRFKLVLHDKPRNDSGYALVVARTGSRLHEANPDESETISGIPRKITSSSIGSPVDRTITITAHHYSMSKFSGILSRLGPGPVLDMTNLNATYDFNLTWNDGLGPSLFTALKEQLGLQLESRKVEVKTIVIDHAEKSLENY